MVIRTSSDFIRLCRRHPEDVFIIHYSCQSLYDDNEALSPKITSIAIVHLSTDQTVSVSTHAIAEELSISREAVQDKFDKIEKKLLDDFYFFTKDRRGKYWVHWNMRSLTYGFEHLEHRFKVLGGTDAPSIPIEQRLNLSDLLADRYGGGFAPHPRMKNLMVLNGGRHRHYLDGPEEVSAFKNREFIRLHNSTLSKVEFFQFVIRSLIGNKLRTAARGYGVLLDKMFESRAVRILTLTGTLVSIFVGLWQAALWIL